MRTVSILRRTGPSCTSGLAGTCPRSIRLGRIRAPDRCALRMNPPGIPADARSVSLRVGGKGSDANLRRYPDRPRSVPLDAAHHDGEMFEVDAASETRRSRRAGERDGRGEAGGVVACGALAVDCVGIVPTVVLELGGDPAQPDRRSSQATGRRSQQSRDQEQGGDDDYDAARTESVDQELSPLSQESSAIAYRLHRAQRPTVREFQLPWKSSCHTPTEGRHLPDIPSPAQKTTVPD